jgi:hypothetical protein
MVLLSPLKKEVTQSLPTAGLPTVGRQAAKAQRKGFPPVSKEIKVWSSRERAVNRGLLSVDNLTFDLRNFSKKFAGDFFHADRIRKIR